MSEGQNNYQPAPDLERAANNFSALMRYICNDIKREAGRDGLNYFLQSHYRAIDNLKAEQDS